MSKPISEWTDAELQDMSDRNCPGSDWATQTLAAEVLRLRGERKALVLGTAEAVTHAEAELAAAREELAILKCPGHEGDPR